MKTCFENEWVTSTEKYVRKFFENEGSGHDWWHTNRVRNLSLQIASVEGGDRLVVEMAALLHDIDDWKMGGEGHGSRAYNWLCQLNMDEVTRDKILQVIEEVSFRGAGVDDVIHSHESAVVQDADRLDAMGAIGIARAFTFGGSRGRLIYHPDIKPAGHDSFESYKKNAAPSVNHFYHKLMPSSCHFPGC